MDGRKGAPELFGQSPMRRKAEDGPCKHVAILFWFHQAKVGLDQTSERAQWVVQIQWHAYSIWARDRAYLYDVTFVVFECLDNGFEALVRCDPRPGKKRTHFFGP